MIDVSAYLERIRYAGPTAPTIETLRALHVAHLLAVPFENLDIRLGRPLSLDDDALFEKIVRRRRGGLCYELNGAFALLLRTLGFPVEYLSASVARQTGEWGPPFDHVLLRVDLDEPWIADVGFGRDSFREPLRLNTGRSQGRYGVSYRLTPRVGAHVLQLLRDGEWIDCYRFELAAHEFAEFEPTCAFHQTSPSAPFSSVPLCGLATVEGRITLVDSRLRIVAGERVEERDLGDGERAAALREYFGLVP